MNIKTINDLQGFLRHCHDRISMALQSPWINLLIFIFAIYFFPAVWVTILETNTGDKLLKQIISSYLFNSAYGLSISKKHDSRLPIKIQNERIFGSCPRYWEEGFHVPFSSQKKIPFYIFPKNTKLSAQCIKCDQIQDMLLIVLYSL